LCEHWYKENKSISFFLPFSSAIMSGGEVELSEFDLLRAIVASLDCSIPPLQVGVADDGNGSAVRYNQ
jgi:hypothetical protein